MAKAARWPILVGAHISRDDAERLRELADAEDRELAVVARKLL